MASARLISASLRAGVSSVAASTCCGVFAEYEMTWRTYCMVSVEAPCVLPPCWLLTNARATPLMSTPLCS